MNHRWTSQQKKEWGDKIESVLPFYSLHEFDHVVNKREFHPLLRDQDTILLSEMESQYYEHQLVLARYMSRNTLYQNLLVIHEMGTGKTLVALAWIDLVRLQDSSSQFIFLAPSQTILYNFWTLLHKFSITFRHFMKTRRVVPENQQTEEAMETRWSIHHKAYGIRGMTYETFAKWLQSHRNEYLEKSSSSLYLICDECHKLHFESKVVCDQPYFIRCPKTRRCRDLRKPDFENLIREWLEQEGLHILDNDRDRQIVREYLDLPANYPMYRQSSRRMIPSGVSVSGGGWTNEKIYRELFRFFHLPQGYKKTLFMTGTPIRDEPSELASLLNLWLPVDTQVPTGTDFIHKYFETKKRTYTDWKSVIPELSWKQEKKTELCTLLNGHVSVYRQKLSDVRIVYQGKSHLPLRHWKVVAHMMSPWQSYYYHEAWKKSTTSPSTSQEQEEDDGESTGLYRDAVQASLFVFPCLVNGEEQGLWGNKGYEYALECKRNQIFWQFSHLPSDVMRMLKNPDEPYKTKIQQIAEYSATYASVLCAILQQPQKVMYVYSNIVHGSGILAFVAMLKSFFGYDIISKASQLEATDMKTPKRRCILFNSALGTKDTDIPKLLHYINQSDNAQGELCHVVCATEKTKEGISIAHIQEIHIMTPSWNMGDLTQAIARGLRQGSHQDLIERGLDNIQVDIYLHCSVPQSVSQQQQQQQRQQAPLLSSEDQCLVQQEIDSNLVLWTQSIDFIRYVRSEQKDENNQLIYRLLLECAWDCSLWKTHNTVAGAENMKNTRECQYTSCHYSCTIPQPSDMTYGTYDLYYNQSEQQIMWEKWNGYLQSSDIPQNEVNLSLLQNVLSVPRQALWFQFLKKMADMCEPSGCPPFGPWKMQNSSWMIWNINTFRNSSLSWCDNPILMANSTYPMYSAYIVYPSWIYFPEDDSTFRVWNKRWDLCVRMIKGLLLRLVKGRVSDTTWDPKESDSYSEDLWYAIIQRLEQLPFTIIQTIWETVWPLYRQQVDNTDAQFLAWFWIVLTSETFPSMFSIEPKSSISLEQVQEIYHLFDSSGRKRFIRSPSWQQFLFVHDQDEHDDDTPSSQQPPLSTLGNISTTTTTASRRTRSSRTNYDNLLTEESKRLYIFENPVGFYGILEARGDFMIRDVRNRDLFLQFLQATTTATSSTSTKSKKILPTGKICNNYQVPDLIYIALLLYTYFFDVLQTWPWYSESPYESYSRKFLKLSNQQQYDLAFKAKSFRNVQSKLTSSQLHILKTQGLVLITLSVLPKQTLLCSLLQEWFRRVGLLQLIS